MYVLPTAHNVCSYTTLAKNLINFHVFNNQYWFYFYKTFFSGAQFWHFFAEIHQKKMLKNTCCSLAPYVLLSSSTFITNQTTAAIKAVIHTVNMKLRKLKKKNVINTNKTWQLKQDSTASARNVLHGCAHKLTTSGSTTKQVLWK